jgi:WD40 repeat protein
MCEVKFPLRAGLVAVSAVVLLSAATPAGAGEKTKDELFDGAKLLHKFKEKVYRVPAFFGTDKGERLLVWFDKFDPMPKPKFPMDRLPDPNFDLVFWDVAAGKEVHKLTYPKDPAPIMPAAPAPPVIAPVLMGSLGSMALAPDGKLAAVFYTYRMVPGKPSHEVTAHIKLYDPETHKWQTLGTPENADKDVPYLVFLKDGSLVILKDDKGRVLEPGKDKPRLTFDLRRGAAAKANPRFNTFRELVASPDGTKLAVSAEGQIVVYDLATGKRLFEPSRAAPEVKNPTSSQFERVALAFSADGQKLLAVEQLMGAPKSTTLARVFDLKEKKELSKVTVAEEQTKVEKGSLGGAAMPANWGNVFAYYSAKDEPRVVFGGKLLDGSNGQTLHTFDVAASVFVSRDGKYLVRLLRAKDDKQLSMEVWSLEGAK